MNSSSSGRIRAQKGRKVTPEYDQSYLKSKRRAVERARDAGAAETRATVETGRVPPGQSLTRKFPVLDLGVQPAWDPEQWTLSIQGLVRNPVQLHWNEFARLPHREQVSDFHCVTRWSKLDVRWRGVPWSVILEMVDPTPDARFVIQQSDDGYSTNNALSEMAGDDVILADTLDGEPLPLEHGGPLRLIVPSLYAWKGAKFLRSLEFKSQDDPGFWEARGYHNRGNPWLEERFAPEWWK